MPGPRFFVDKDFRPESLVGLPAGPARHAQVLRLQPGDPLVLFNGRGGEWLGEISHMGKTEVQVLVHRHDPVERENATRVIWALGMPTNERMDNLVEKATELGVSRIQPLVCQRSVLRLQEDRAVKKVAHWQAVAISACEQCGRNTIPTISPVLTLPAWLASLEASPQTLSARFLLSPRESSLWRPAESATQETLTFLSGPEGGLSEQEETLARNRGFSAVSLGARILRADTAPLMVLSTLAQSR